MKKGAVNMAKRKIANVPKLDLRKFSPEALRKIESIKNVAVLIVADDEEALEAFGEIEVSNVATIRYIPRDREFKEMNGTFILTGNMVQKDTEYFLNGICIVCDLPKDLEISLSFNGILLIQKSSNVIITCANGLSFYDDFEADMIKIFSNTVTVSPDFVNEAKPGTYIIAGNSITVSNDVTADMLREKGIRFVAGNIISCGKHLVGYVENNSKVGNCIEIIKGKKS